VATHGRVTPLNVIKNSFVWTVVGGVLPVRGGPRHGADPQPQFRLRWLGRSVIIIPWVIPGVVAAWCGGSVDAQFGFLNNLLACWESPPCTSTGWASGAGNVLRGAHGIWKGFGFSMLMYLAALQTVPPSLYESAQIDGADGVQHSSTSRFPRLPGHPHHDLLTAIWTFNYFEIIWVMTGGGPIRSTHIAPTYIYELAFMNFNFGNASVSRPQLSCW